MLWFASQSTHTLLLIQHSHSLCQCSCKYIGLNNRLRSCRGRSRGRCRLLLGRWHCSCCLLLLCQHDCVWWRGWLIVCILILQNIICFETYRPEVDQGYSYSKAVDQCFETYLHGQCHSLLKIFVYVHILKGWVCSIELASRYSQTDDHPLSVTNRNVTFHSRANGKHLRRAGAVRHHSLDHHRPARPTAKESTDLKTA